MSNYYLSNVQRTLRSAVLAGWLVDAKARTDLAFVVRALTSDRAIGYYVNAIDTFVWLCEVAYVSGQIARLLVAIAATWIDETVSASQPIPDVDIDIEEVLSEYDAYHKPVLEDAVVPFTRPVPAIESAPIDWKLWGVRDLRAASQRAPFDIPARDESGKMFNKAALVEMYDDALHFAVWGEEVEAA